VAAPTVAPKVCGQNATFTSSPTVKIQLMPERADVARSIVANVIDPTTKARMV